MTLKNRSLLRLSFLLLIFCMLMFSGCTTSKFVEFNKNIDVMGLKLDMSEDDAIKLINEKGISEPCIYGYEIAFSENAVNLGFRNEDHGCRRIMTENPQTKIYGITPGMTVNESYKIMSQTQFVKAIDSKYNFAFENVALKLISTDGIILKGIIIEIIAE